MSDLSLVPTDDLVDALRKRFDVFIFAGLQRGEKPGKDVERQAWDGHALWAQGLAAELIRRIQDWERDEDDAVEDERT
jgi:hypothetical protein